MCTLALGWKVLDACPILVGANRDESLNRPASPPRVFDDDPIIYAPKDDRCGGTWIGVNEHGLFVGITNLWTDWSPSRTRSRGLLVADALTSDSAESAISMVRSALKADTYDGFILLIVDSGDAAILNWDGELSISHLNQGYHVVSNVGYDDSLGSRIDPTVDAETEHETARRIRTSLSSNPIESRIEWFERMRSTLIDHDLGACVHADGFGTRSSSIISIGDEITYEFSEGPPCQSEYESITFE